MVVGYDDGGAAPNKPLTLVPGAVRDAEAFLAHRDETRDRFDRVATLVEGFESPLGLELLTTVHWVIVQESARSLDELVAHTYAWNERKRQFTSRQIGIAAEWLQQHECVDRQAGAESA